MPKAAKAPFELEYAQRRRQCAANLKICSNHAIPAGTLCLGSRVNAQGNTTASARLRWMHWQCGFKRHLNHLKNIHKISSADAITGFEDLKSADKFKLREAWYKKEPITQDTAHVETPTTAKTPAVAAPTQPPTTAKTPGRAERRTPGQQATIPRTQNQVQLGDIPEYKGLTSLERAKVWDARAAGRSYDDLRDLVVTLYNARANRG